jgi:hypothetical protein
VCNAFKIDKFPCCLLSGKLVHPVNTYTKQKLDFHLKRYAHRIRVVEREYVTWKHKAGAGAVACIQCMSLHSSAQISMLIG